MKRSDYNGYLTLKDLDRDVILIGWVAKKRNLGSLIFINLRDKTGIVQITINKNNVEIPEIRNEYIIQVYGKVTKKNSIKNDNEIEVIATKINVINTAINPPFIIDDSTDALEDTRLKYRYLDLRRPINQKRLAIRAKIVKIVHEFLDAHEFLEIETPILTLSTPEGARDFLVPSRLHHGCFYALPQSPQIYKQLLMIGGIERYYQIAKCFRDEDLRADRQPDFTQIDIEVSFLDENEVLNLIEKLIANIFKKVINYEISLPLKKIKYDEAVAIYGSDKPDTRFEMFLIDIKDILQKSTYQNFQTINTIKAIIIKNIADKTSRKDIDNLQLQAKKFFLKNYIVLKMIDNNLMGNFTKFLNPQLIKELINRTNIQNNDLMIIAGDENYYNVCFGLGALRNEYAHKLNLIQDNTYDLLWIYDFPLFEKNKEGQITSSHHPFTRPKDEDLLYLKTDPLKVHAYAYDIVINGYEVGGGSLRIYDQNMQKDIFKILGLNEEDIQHKFGFFIEAFKYGTPPHAGIALGLERLTMILSHTNNIRDVIAFPKNLAAICPMSNSPAPIEQKQLNELGIVIVDKK